MSDIDQQKWNHRYAAQKTQAQPTPAAVLTENQHLLPNTGATLDLACGLGGNALFLARRGLQVDAWDVAELAVEKLNELAVSQGLAVHTEARDVVANPPPPNSFDVIVVSRFLQRQLVPSLIEALKPKGLVFYQTFVQDKPPGIGPQNPDYLLAENELLKLFSVLRILVYREEGGVGDVLQGFRHEAMLVGQRK